MNVLCAGKRGDWLVWLTLLFLFFPHMIYSCTWLRWYIAVPYTGILLVSFVKALKKETIETDDSRSFSLAHWLPLSVIAVLLLTWNYFSGAGFFAYQNGDWIKHNAITMDLINKPWPIMYTLDGRNDHFPLVYYLAYYLPIGLLGKLMPTQFTVTYIAYAWNVLATCLLVGWLFRFIGKVSILAVVIFIFFSGLDIVPYYLTGIKPPLTMHIEWWLGVVGGLQFSSNSTALFWVPQHAFGAWLGTSLLLHSFLCKKNVTNTLFYWALTLFWSPFVFVGLFFLVVFDLIYKKFKGLLSFQNCIGCFCIVAVLGLFYASRVLSNGPELSTLTQLEKIWPSMLAFITLECLVYIPFTLWVFKTGIDRKFRCLLLIVLANILCSILFRLGIYNDFCMRVSLPGLFILQILVLKNILPFYWRERPLKIAINILFLVVIIIGAQTSFREIYRGIVGNKSNVNFNSSLDKDLNYDALLLYLGNENSFYCKYISALTDKH